MYDVVCLLSFNKACYLRSFCLTACGGSVAEQRKDDRPGAFSCGVMVSNLARKTNEPRSNSGLGLSYSSRGLSFY